MAVVGKAEKRAPALTKLMPNIGRPGDEKRKALLEVVHSTILYAVPIWKRATEIVRYKNALDSVQRKMLLRVSRAYRTVSAKAVQIITEVPLAHLLVGEREQDCKTLLWELYCRRGIERERKRSRYGRENEMKPWKLLSGREDLYQK